MEQGSWLAVLDIAIAAAMLYFLYTWLQRTRSAPIVLGIVAFGLLYIVASTLGLHLTTRILQGFYAIALIAVIIIFQPELRRILETVGFIGGRANAYADDPASCRAVAETLFDFGARRVGALVVLPGRTPLERHLGGGVELNGTVSPQLLWSIFDPHSAGHDGAAVLEGDQLTRFGCYLPLSQQPDLHPRYGTRHRAALGISEVTDCLAIIVSEERGEVTVAHNGVITLQPNAVALQRTIQEFLRTARPEHRTGLARARGLVRRPLAKVGAVVAAAGLWLLTGAQTEPTVRALVESPVLYENLPDNLYVASREAERVRAEIEGPPAVIAELQKEPPPLVVDLADLGAGTHGVPVTSEHFRIPNSVRVLDAEPGTITVGIESFMSSTVPVGVTLQGQPAVGYRIDASNAEPAFVRVLHRGGAIPKDLAIATEPVTVEGIRRSMDSTARLVWPTGVRPAPGQPEQVMVHVHVSEVVAPPRPPAASADHTES